MSGSLNINNSNQLDLAAPTPQNTPLTHAPIAQQGLSRPTVPDISEADEDAAIDEAGTIAKAMQTGAMEGALAGMVQNKLNTLIGKSSGYIESLPVDVKRTVAALQGVQTKLTEVQNNFKREVWELEKKYLELSKAHYERREALITGTAIASAEEIELGEADEEKHDETYQRLPKSEGGTVAASPITDFWLTALRNHPGMSELITDRDAGALKHLVDIRLSYDVPQTTTQQPGFKLSFVFTPNEYFENTVLEKTYLYQPEIDYSGDFMYDRAIGTTIQWKDDKNLTTEFEIKKQRNKNTNRTRLVRKAHPTESFFNFFNPPQPPSPDAVTDEIDEDELDDLESRLELDYQIGEDLKERVIPRAIDYFTGKALEYEDDSDFEDMDDDEDDEDDEDISDEDDDDSDSDHDDAPPKRKGGAGVRGAGTGARGKGKGGAGKVTAEECKQQ